MGARRMAGGLLAVATLLTACSSGGSGVSASSGPSVEDDPSTAAEDDPRSDADWQADADIAESGLLTIDDFPADWIAGPPQQDTGYDQARDELADCLGIDRSLLESRNPRALSPTFATPEGDQAAVSVTMTPSPERTSRTIEIMSRDDAPGCYAEVTAAMLTEAVAVGGSMEGTEVGEPSHHPLSFDGLGDDSVAFRVVVPLTTGGATMDLFTDVLVVRVGRVGINAGYQSLASPFDSDEAVRLTQLMVDRVRAADAG